MKSSTRNEPTVWRPGGLAKAQISTRLVALSIALAIGGCASPVPADVEYNRGVDAYRAKDFAAARVHWASAVAAGNPSAENNLGYLLYYGLGGAADQPRAVSLWRKAAYAGHAEAQWHLGHAYKDGTAVPKDNVEAYAWFRCAVASAESVERDEVIAGDARKSLEKLLSDLSKEEFSSGEALAKQYVRKYSSRRSGA